MPTTPLGDWGGGTPAADACRGDDGGLINPELFACRASDLQPNRVETAADDLTSLGDAISWEMTGISAEWQAMAPWYEAPEQERMLALMNAPADDARTIQSSFGTAAGLLLDYAQALVGIQRDLADLEYRATEFRNRVKDGLLVPASQSERPSLPELWIEATTDAAVMTLVPWYQDTEASAENARLLAEHDALVHRLTVAADEVENGIMPLVTQGTTLEDTQPIPEGALTNPLVEQPWGWPRDEDRNTLEEIGNGFYRIGGGLLDMLALVGIDARGGQSGPGFALHSWLGAGNVLGSLAITLIYPPNKLHQVPPLWHGWLQQRYDTAATLGLAVGYDAAATDVGADPWHLWDSDPIATGMDSVFNVASVFAPGGAAVGGARWSAKAAWLARFAGGAADFVIAGGSYLLAGTVRVASRLAHWVGRGDDVVLGGVRVNVAEVISGATPVSDELFPPTTAEPPSSGTSPETAAGSGSGAGGGSGSSGGPGGGDGGGSGGGPPEDPRRHVLTPEQVIEYQNVQPQPMDTARTQTYTSGDPLRPGGNPAQPPDLTFDTATGDSGWRTVTTTGNSDSIAYQEQIAGVESLPNGTRPEYTALDSTGDAVDFDGHVYRGEPPQEVFLEAKLGYQDLVNDPGGSWASRVRAKLLKQALRQRDALPPGAVLEWHVSDARSASAIAKLFEEANVPNVDVVYTPVR